jgi:hypothetical protein
MAKLTGEDQPKPVRWVGSHAFQKKSKRGVATPRSDLELIDRRLKRAKEGYEQWLKGEKRPSR